MTLEILSDFFLFISSNQKQINENDLQSFEYFISKQFSIINSHDQNPTVSKELNEISSSSNIIQSLYSFLTEFLFYLYTQQIIHLDSNYLHLIDSKSINILKQKGLFSNEVDSYLEQQKRNIELQQIKTKETKRMLLKLLKETKLFFQIEPFHYISFLNSNNKYISVIIELMNKIKLWNDLYKEHNNNDDKCKSDLDKTHHEHNKSGLSYDKEHIIKDKKKFLEVIDKIRDNNNNNNNVTTNNIINISIDLNDKNENEATVKENEINIQNQNNDNNNICEQNEIFNKTHIIQHNNISSTDNNINNNNEHININNFQTIKKESILENNEVKNTPRNHHVINLDNNVTQDINENALRKNTLNEINDSSNINTTNNNNNENHSRIPSNSSKITTTEKKSKQNQTNSNRKKNKNIHCCIII